MPLIIPLGSSRTAATITGVPASDSVVVAVADGLRPLAATIRRLETFPIGLGDEALVAGDGRPRSGEPLPLLVTELAALSGQGNPVLFEAVPMPLGEQVSLTGIERAGQDLWPLVVLDEPWAGLQESWTGVADTLADVNGAHTWTRPVGTKFSVRGQRAMLASETTGEGFQIARCATSIGTSDYEVQATALHVPNDAGLVVTAVLARVDAPATTFYQFRVVDWGGSQMVDCWRNTPTIPWTRLAGPVYRAIPNGVRLRFRVLGSGPVTLTAWLDNDLVLGPVDDAADAITSGTNIGIFADWSSGTQAEVGLDDVRVLAFGVGLGAQEFGAAEALGARIGERVGLQRGWYLGEMLPLPVAEWPIATFYPKAALDRVRVQVLDVLQDDRDLDAPLQIGLEETAVSLPLQYPDVLAVQWGERESVGRVLTDGEPVAVVLEERNEVLTTLIAKGAADPVPVSLMDDTAIRTVLTIGLLGLMRPVGEVARVAGPTGDTVGVAGPTAESAVTEA